ncbi:MAG: TOBE domain-containing protein [Chromatiales bacterium]|nr:TOBE domain-containing protein [Chromatiales bacterium]
MKTSVAGRFWLNVDDRGFLGTGRVELLERIRRTGSISAAAREMGMSYKAAWDAVDAMNRLAEQPLVLRQAGGSRGGGTRLTPFGERAIAQYRAAEAEYHRFMDRLREAMPEPEDSDDGLRLQTSVANQFRGQVSRIDDGGTLNEVTIDAGGRFELTAIVSASTMARMALAPGKAVMALMDPTMILLAEPQAGAHYSARNRLRGTVLERRNVGVNGEVRIDLGGGLVLLAIVTSESLAASWLRPGRTVEALVKAQHLMLAATA